MYIPKHFKITDLIEIQKFIDENSFGTLISVKDGKPVATHLSLQLTIEENAFFISGHMAYGNSQWRTFETNTDVLLTFQGPHAYISSSWYEQENVPTWNYQAVHLSGSARLLNKTELKEELTKLMEKHEFHRERPVLWDTLSPALLEKEMTGIVGFKIRVTKIEAKYKMSQNRTAVDYQNVIDHLKQEGKDSASQLADVMENHAKSSL